MFNWTNLDAGKFVWNANKMRKWKGCHLLFCWSIYSWDIWEKTISIFYMSRSSEGHVLLQSPKLFFFRLNWKKKSTLFGPLRLGNCNKKIVSVVCLSNVWTQNLSPTWRSQFWLSFYEIWYATNTSVSMWSLETVEEDYFIKECTPQKRVLFEIWHLIMIQWDFAHFSRWNSDQLWWKQAFNNFFYGRKYRIKNVNKDRNTGSGAEPLPRVYRVTEPHISKMFITASIL